MKAWIFFQIFKELYEKLNCLQSKDITELKCLVKPPVYVEALVTSVAAMFGISGDWITLKNYLCHPDKVKEMQKINIVEIHRKDL